MALFKINQLYPNGPKCVANEGIPTKSKIGKAVGGLTKGKVGSGVVTNNFNHCHHQQVANLQMLPVNMNLILITGANLFLNNQHDADEEHHTVDVNYDSGAEDGETGVNDEIDTAEVDCA
jgi:hypothetical protein